MDRCSPQVAHRGPSTARVGGDHHQAAQLPSEVIFLERVVTRRDTSVGFLQPLFKP